VRIGLVAPPWIPVPPPSYGGTELVVGQLAAKLVEHGHEVVLVAHPDSDVPGAELVPCARVPDGTIIGQSLAELRHVLQAYERLLPHGPDVIHDHTSVGAVAGARLARTAGVPLVTTNHGPFDDDARIVFGESAKIASVVAISQAQAAMAGPVPIAAVIHHGIEPGEIPFGAGAGGYYACLGRLDPRKGIAVAARLAREAGVPLRIAAKMWEPAEIRYFDEVLRPLLGGGVEFVGEVAGADKYRFLGDAIALLNPIAWPEPFGLNMIEAMMCGTPVVATPCGSAPELIRPGTNGFIVNSHTEFVAALDHAARLDRHDCRDDAERRFSAQRMADDHESLYQQVTAPSLATMAAAGG
jgi:glycosyltransferase involved in cell wall biosynthesis